MEMNAQWEAIILAMIVSVVAPLILSYSVNRSRKAEKEQDWKREDQVRARVAEVAKALDEVSKSTASKLEVIHALVNSDMTAAMQDSLDSSTREHAALLELCASRRDSGKEPLVETLAAISLAEAKIAELTANLADRKRN